MPSILVATGFVRIDSDTQPALKAIKSLGAIGASTLTTTLLPATAAVSAGLAAVAASAAVAAGAMAVYGAAVKPQFEDISKAMKQQQVAEDSRTKAAVNASLAQDLAAKSGFKYGQQVKITKDMTEDAKLRAQEYNTALSASKSASTAAGKAQALYKSQLDGMPPATRKTAEALAKLKEENTEWSRSLSASTMPVFTQGINFLRGLLPKLTPIVHNVATEIQGFVNGLGEGSAGKIFKEFGRNVQSGGASALRAFLEIGKNLTAGLIGILNAFMPMSAGVTGGLQEMTEKFATWSANLGKSKGFNTFIQTAKDAGPVLGEAFASIARALGDISEAAGPLAGIGLKVLSLFAQLVDAIPTPVLRVLVPAILAVNIALKAYAIYTAAATAFQWLFTTSITASTGVLYTSRAVMIFHRIQLILTAIATAAVTVATWAWTAALTAGRLVMVLVRGAILAFRYALVAVRLAIVLTTTAFRLLAIAMISNPIGLVILAVVALVAAFVILWKKSETFRNFWKMVWEGIKTAAQVVADWFTGPFVDSFVKTWKLIKQNVIDPIVWFFTKGVPAAARFLRDAVVAELNALFRSAKMVWDAIYIHVVQPLIRFFTVDIPRGIGNGRDKAVALWNGLRDRLLGIWRGILRLIINPFITFFTVNMPRGIGNGRDKVVNLWNGLRDRLVGVYGGIRDRVFIPLRNFFVSTIPGWARTLRDKVQGFFREMRDGIGRIWTGIQSKTKSPINWVIRNVWNKGIVGVWKKITGWIGLGNKLGTIKELASGGTVGKAVPGMFNKPTAIVGEGNPRYPEYVIPTDPKYATRAKGLWSAAGAHFMADGGVLGGISDFLSDPSGMTKKLFKPLLGKLSILGDSPWAKMVGRFPRMAIDGLQGLAGKALKGLLGSIGLGPSGGGIQRWSGVVQQALRMVGQPAAYLGITLRRMNQESGGNPTAVNRTDSNWQAGHPSVGLMQVIEGTFKAYAGSLRKTGPFMYGVSVNPLANIYASMRYALSRYGSLPSAYNRPGGYRNGTAGAAGGWHLFGEAGPEMGFSPSGWRILNSQRTAGLGGGGLTIQNLILENHGVIGSRQEVEDWLVASLTDIGRKGRVPKSFGGS